MLIRDSGVVQLFAENAQEAYDLMVIAPRLAEHPAVLLPVLVCLDGFTITHAAELVELVDDDDVRCFIGDYDLPHPMLDVREPFTQGPFAMPDHYFELRRAQTAALDSVHDAFAEIAEAFQLLSHRPLVAVEEYRLDDADRVIVALGSTAGTVKDTIDELRGEGERVGLLRVCSFRPFPAVEVTAALMGVESVIVLDRADSPGGTPPLHAEVAAALYGSGCALRGHVYGLGGRELHPEDIRRIFASDQGAYVGVRGAECPA
jgi:pyruvate ferredoxin oxidoreductase alpha subunit